MAATVLGEAEGESLAGKCAVAWVIQNRARDARWPDTTPEVCLQRLQFSCWNDGSPRIQTMKNPEAHGVKEATWAECIRASLEAAWNLQPDATRGANHYLAPSSLPRLPRWATVESQTVKIGNHLFYRL
jgi:spore germination cell wall hydrolase CwlJ-like protein